MDLLRKILWRSQNRWQLTVAGLGAAIGLFLLLGAVQLYFDVRYLLHKDAGADPHYVQINKRVSLLNTFAGVSSFSENEIEEILDHSSVSSVGVFTSSDFRVSAASESLGFYTELFFEAVPDGFLDVVSPRFRWEEGSREIPILLSRDYLALYNFGFAPSQGLPQLTPATIQRVRFDLTLGNGARRAEFEGRIVGFSDRFNSILVPQSFMNWANRTFGDSAAPQAPSRLILEVDNPQSDAFLDFVEDHNFELSTGRLVGGQVLTMVGFLTLVLLAIGGLIFLLAGVIMILNFRLTIVAARDDIDLLLQLGYKPFQITNFLHTKMMRWFGGTIGAGFLTFLVLHQLLASAARAQGLEITGMVNPLVLALFVVLAGGFLYLNYQLIKWRVEN